MIEESALVPLPGYEIYKDGMYAMCKGELNSAPAMLMSMASTRLARAGLPIPHYPHSVPVHLAFYGLLASQFPDPHFRYNASLQRLDKFCRAVERLGSL